MNEEIEHESRFSDATTANPGNFATNVQGDAQFGYLLIWMVFAANLMAMLIFHSLT